MASHQIIEFAWDLVRLLDTADESGWRDEYELSAEINRMVDTLGEAIPQKLDAISYVIDNMKAEAQKLRSWEKELAQKRRAQEAGISRLQQTAASLLTASRESGLFIDAKTGRVKVNRDHGATRSHWLAATESVEGPESPELWPEGWRIKTFKPDKKSALAALKSGDTVDGFQIVRREGWRSR